MVKTIKMSFKQYRLICEQLVNVKEAVGIIETKLILRKELIELEQEKEPPKNGNKENEKTINPGTA